MRTVFFGFLESFPFLSELSGHSGHSHNVAHSRAVMRQSLALRQPHGSLANSTALALQTNRHFR